MPERKGSSLPQRVQVALTATTIVANAVGAVAVFVLLVFVLPGGNSGGDGGVHLDLANTIAVPLYSVGAILVGSVWGTRSLRRRLQWLLDGRTPTRDEQRSALRAPFRILIVQGSLWAGAVAFFTLLNGIRDPSTIAPVLFTVSMGGLTTGAAAYLMAERVLRPVAAIALSDDPPSRPLVPGVTSRALLAWTLGSAIPVVGLIVTATFTLADDDISADRLAVSVLALGGVTILIGAFIALLTARSTAAAVQSVREGLTAVEAGDLAVRVPVFDGTEVGLLQAGFNRMADGLADRERIRDLFGRHVGEEVARSAIARGIEIGGELREVGVLFVDVVGSTRLSIDNSPSDVVGLLNRFFGVVIDVVDANAGLVNKFEGDAILAIFGAPSDTDDPAGAALRAARQLIERLGTDVMELDAAIGVSAGTVVAGNVGTERRYEYTVIGDPVNEAARLTDLAKGHPGQVLASGAAVDATHDVDERGRWQPTDEAPVLRGRAEPTPTWAPARPA